MGHLQTKQVLYSREHILGGRFDNMCILLEAAPQPGVRPPAAAAEGVRPPDQSGTREGVAPPKPPLPLPPLPLPPAKRW